MEILGIGPLELLLIMVLALIIFGPKDIEKAGRTVGRGLYKLLNSETWRTLNHVSKKIRTLPNMLMREANLEDMEKKKAATEAKPDQGVDDDRVQSPEDQALPGKVADEDLGVVKKGDG